MTKYLANTNGTRTTERQTTKGNALKTRTNQQTEDIPKMCRNGVQSVIETTKLLKLAEQLVKSHPDMSLSQALDIERKRQDAKKRRDEESVVDLYKSCRIEEDFEKYMREADNYEMKDPQDISDKVEEIIEYLEEIMLIDEKENF